MTTNDLATGRSAANRRPLKGFFRLSSSVLFCAALCCVVTPAFAKHAATGKHVAVKHAAVKHAVAKPAKHKQVAVKPAAPKQVVATQAVAETVVAPSDITTTTPAPAAATISSLPAVSDAMPLPDRAILFAGDINRLIASQPVTATTAELPSGGRVQTLLKRALALLGTPYRWGGTGTSGFDCSGMVGYVFKTALGIELPRVSRDMAGTGQLISDRSKLSPGDLVFFGHKGRVSHVGIYVGEGRFVHAPSTGKDVMVSSLDSGYWGNKYMQARRIAGI